MQILPLETKCIHCHRRFTYNLSRGRPMVCPHCGIPQIKVKKGEKRCQSISVLMTVTGKRSH